MADEERTDWTSIAAYRRKRISGCEVVEGTFEQVVLKVLGVISTNLDVLALAEAERMVVIQKREKPLANQHQCKHEWKKDIWASQGEYWRCSQCGACSAKDPEATP